MRPFVEFVRKNSDIKPKFRTNSTNGRIMLSFLQIEAEGNCSRRLVAGFPGNKTIRI
jgi:hypothetical protein